jgi:5'-nucleotidase
MDTIEQVRRKVGFIVDMDGVIYHGNQLISGVVEFIRWLDAEKKKYLFLTNSSERSPRELQQKLERLGIQIAEEHFYTSALATAAFLKSQQPNGSVFAIGDGGLINALYDAGFTMNDVNPDYVVVGESKMYTYEKITHAIRLVLKGAKLIGTNPDVTGPTDMGLVPATGALMAPIELATGARAYYVGKPNPLIMRHALKKLDCRREDAVIVGDRMDTDIVAGIESEIETVLVLSGVTIETDLRRFAYRPRHILKNVGEIANAAHSK